MFEIGGQSWDFHSLNILYNENHLGREKLGFLHMEIKSFFSIEESGTYHVMYIYKKSQSIDRPEKELYSSVHRAIIGTWWKELISFTIESFSLQPYVHYLKVFENFKDALGSEVFNINLVDMRIANHLKTIPFQLANLFSFTRLLTMNQTGSLPVMFEGSHIFLSEENTIFDGHFAEHLYPSRI